MFILLVKIKDTDKMTGLRFDRPGWLELKKQLRENDVVYLDSLDRLGRDYEGIIKEWMEITREFKVDIVCLDNAELFDSRKFKAMGEIGQLLETQFLFLLAYVAQAERVKIKERQKAGIVRARARGIHVGRPKIDINDNFIAAYKLVESGEITARQGMQICGMKNNTWYARCADYRNFIADGSLFY